LKPKAFKNFIKPDFSKRNSSFKIYGVRVCIETIYVLFEKQFLIGVLKVINIQKLSINLLAIF
jgi:hypothetical protein